MLRAAPGTAGHRTTLRGDRGAARRLVLAQASGREGVKAVIEGLSALGPLRFICIGDGGILEVAQKFDQVSYNDIPNKGTYCTLKTDDRGFEAHIALDKVSEGKLVKSKPRQGDYDIYKVSFLRDGGGSLMTCLLHGPDGNYEPGAVEAWEALRDASGETVAGH
eukprot:jgi/Tetstr1/421174/TSEL_012216.t1